MKHTLLLTDLEVTKTCLVPTFLSIQWKFPFLLLTRPLVGTLVFLKKILAAVRPTTALTGWTLTPLVRLPTLRTKRSSLLAPPRIRLPGAASVRSTTKLERLVWEA